MRQRLIMGNWKMNGGLVANQALLSAIVQGVEQTNPHAQIAICPSFPYLGQVQQYLQNSLITLGAQDVSVANTGAYTGEVSASMLKDFSCQWVIVGHSERRSYHGESSEMVAVKAQRALEYGITPVICVGESLSNREAGKTLVVIQEQLAPVLALGAAMVSQIVVAYEPVWAIGTGLTATPEQAQEVHAFIRSQLASVNAQTIQILYGGSVKANNAANLFAMPDIDGALVGGAALDAKEFLAIITA